MTPDTLLTQNPLTLRTPILPGHLDNLRLVLSDLKADLSQRKAIGIEAPGTIHFARWVILDAKPNPANNPENEAPTLIFSSNFDGSVEEHIRTLASDCGTLIDRVYEHCENYPETSERTVANRMAYLKRWDIGVSAFYRGSPNRTVKQILGEQSLRDYLRSVLDRGNWEGKSALEIHRTLLQFVKEKPEFNWAASPFHIPKIRIFGMILMVLTLLVLLPFIIIWILILHFRFERSDTNFTKTRSQLNEHEILGLESYEDLDYQNQFTQLVVMKAGSMRLLTFKGMMLFARVLIPNLFVKGKLMGIPTIHFARWVLFDNNKRVLFFSNFDGSWQQYLGDFIDKSGWGLTGIFSNTTNFPKTNFLFTGGAYDEEHFLAWSRSTEIATHMWYSAYPNLSIKNVNNNTLIRIGLFKIRSESGSQKFLSLI